MLVGARHRRAEPDRGHRAPPDPRRSRPGPRGHRGRPLSVSSDWPTIASPIACIGPPGPHHGQSDGWSPDRGARAVPSRWRLTGRDLRRCVRRHPAAAGRHHRRWHHLGGECPPHPQLRSPQRPRSEGEPAHPARRGGAAARAPLRGGGRLRDGRPNRQQHRLRPSRVADNRRRLSQRARHPAPRGRPHGFARAEDVAVRRRRVLVLPSPCGRTLIPATAEVLRHSQKRGGRASAVMVRRIVGTACCACARGAGPHVVAARRRARAVLGRRPFYEGLKSCASARCLGRPGRPAACLPGAVLAAR